MSENPYRQNAIMGATAMDLILTLYAAALRFLYRARQAVQEDDTLGRRYAVKRVVDILIYLQARLRPDVGGAPAIALGEFYAAMFTMTLEASHIASVEAFDEVILCVQNVRDAWAIVAKDPQAGKLLPRELRTHEEKFIPKLTAQRVDTEQTASRWSA